MTRPVSIWPIFLSAALAFAPGCDKLNEALDKGDPPAEINVDKEDDKKPENGEEKKADEKKAEDGGEAKAVDAKSGLDAWVAFSSDAGKFECQFPKAPKSEKMPTATVIGNIDQNMFSVEFSDAWYGVSYSDYPKEIVDGSEPGKMLDGARDGAVGNLGGKLASEKQVEIDGHPGRAIEIIATDATAGITMEVTARIYLVKNRLYQILVVREKGRDLSKELEKFLSSFKLAK